MRFTNIPFLSVVTPSLVGGGPAEYVGAVGLSIGTDPVPGPQNISVPSDAEGILVFWYGYYSAPGDPLTTMTSTAAGVFTSQQLNTDHLSFNVVGFSAARITAVGAQTITPEWASGWSGGAEPTFIVAFVKSIPPSGSWLRDFVLQQVGSGTITEVVSSQVEDLILVLDANDSSFGSPPADIENWTSRLVQAASRLSNVDVVGDPSTTVAGNASSFAGLAAVSIIGT